MHGNSGEEIVLLLKRSATLTRLGPEDDDEVLLERSGRSFLTAWDPRVT
jgi:hypothetical protein